MKKRTLTAIAFASVFAITSLVSCGGEAPSEATSEAVTEEVTEAVEETTEEVAEETTVEALPGEAKFEESGCVACHQVQKKIVGPALKDIAAAYADNKDGLVLFLNGEGEAIVDPAQAAIMAPNLEITKAMSEEDRIALADYIMSTAE